MFASDQSDVKLFHKVRRVALLTYTANGSKLRKVSTIEEIYIMSAMNL